MQTSALKAYPLESLEIREHLILRGFLEGIENSHMRLRNLRNNLSEADLTLDKTLERALHIEAVARVEEEDKKTRISTIQSNKNSQLVNLIYDLVRTLQTNQSNRQDNQRFYRKKPGQKSFCAEVSEVQEKPEIDKDTITALPEAITEAESRTSIVPSSRK